MPLKPVTHDFLALVERETGYPVRLIEDPALETLARVRMARGTVPAHFVSQYVSSKRIAVDRREANCL